MDSIEGKELSVHVNGHEKRPADGKVLYKVVFEADGGSAGLGTAGSVLTWESGKRYSEFADLRTELERLHGAQIKALPFPPKDLRNSEEVLRARERTLEEFLQASVEIITPAEQCDGSAAAVLYRFLAPQQCRAESAAAVASPMLRSRMTVLVLENQRCGGLGDAFSMAVPSEKKYSKDKLMGIDPKPWTSAAGCERPPPDTMSRYPMPGWRWEADSEWKKGPWEYRPNFIGAAEATSASYRGWETEMNTQFGKKSWVRRRRWTRVVERDPDTVWSGRLEKRKLAGSDHRWFVVTKEALCYYQLQHANDSYDDIGAPVMPPPAAPNGGVIPFEEIEAIFAGAASTDIAEDTFKVQLNTGRELCLRTSSSAAVELWTSKLQEASGKLADSDAIRNGVAGAVAADRPALLEGALHSKSDVILCAAVGVRTGADDWLDKDWMEGAAVVLTPLYVHVFDSGPPEWWANDQNDGSTAKMIRSLRLSELRLQSAPTDKRTVTIEKASQSSDKPYELRLHTAARQTCLRLAFETHREREEWAVALNKAVGDLAAGDTGVPVVPAPLLPSDDEKMPAENCLVHVQISGHHSMPRQSQYFCVRPEYFALFESLELLQAHLESPCLNRPTIFYRLYGMQVVEAGDGFKLKTADDRTLSLTGPDGVADHIRSAISNELSRQEEEGAPSCRGCQNVSLHLDHYVDVVRKVQANSNYSKHQRMIRESAAEAEAERMRMVEKKDMERLETFEGYASKVVRRDWQAREIVTPSQGIGTRSGGSGAPSRMVTPALENMFSLCKILLQSDASIERKGEEISAVLTAFSNELSSVLQTTKYNPMDETEARIALRLHVLAWIHNCVLLDSYVEELLYRQGIETADTSSLYHAARACQAGVTRLYKGEMDRLLAIGNGAAPGKNGGLFNSMQKADSPVREATEFFYSACTTEMRIQDCRDNSVAVTRICRQIADDVLHHFADQKYFPTLLKKIKPPVTQRISVSAARVSTTTVDFELRDFKFVLEHDLDVLEQVYRQFYLLLSEAAEDILVTSVDDSCIETVDFSTESPEDFGLSLNQSCTSIGDLAARREESQIYRARRDEKLPFPLIVESAVKGSRAYSAGLRRGMVMIASRNDSLGGEQSFLQLEIVQPLSATVLTLGELCEELSAVRALADSVGDDEKSLRAYVRLCDYDTTLAYELVSAVPNWQETALSRDVAKIDTSSILNRQLSSSARAQRGHLRNDEKQFQVRWWNAPRGSADELAAARLPGSQFLSLRNMTTNTLSVSLEWQESASSWWQPPPSAFVGNGQLFTWAAAPAPGSSSFFGDTRGAIVISGRSPSGKQVAIAVGWSTPCLAFSPRERQKLLRQGFGPEGSYPRKPIVLMEPAQNLQRPEQLQAHLDRALPSRQSKAQCRCSAIQVTCEVLTKVDRTALVQQLEYLSPRKLREKGVEHGVWPTLQAASAETAEATKQDIMQQIVAALCGDSGSKGLTCPQGGMPDSMFMKLSNAVTDKDLHQCVFTISEMTAVQRDFADGLDQLVKKMNEHPSLIAETRRYLLSEYHNCFVGKQLVSWLVSAVQKSPSKQRLLQTADVSLQQLVPAENSASISCEQQLELLKHLLQAVEETASTALIEDEVDAAAVRQIALLRDGIVTIGRSMIEFGMVRHVVDEHDFKDEELYYRVAYVPRGSRRRVRKGLLEKQPGTGLVKKFEKRWFELEEGTGTLHYYREEYGKKAGTIPPADSGHTIRSIKAAAGSREISIQCGPPFDGRSTLMGGSQDEDQDQDQGRTFLLRAGSAEEAQEWADAILQERDSYEPGPSRTPLLDPPAKLQPEPELEPEPEPEPEPEFQEGPGPGPEPTVVAELEEAEPPGQPPVKRTRSKRANTPAAGAGFLCCGSRP